ncbi:MAG: DUF1934 domain-containing protein [Lachnospiraceae bacterium]|nr:DUF1934 domain-containing protein [Lachnospiraceae bacterium]
MNDNVIITIVSEYDNQPEGIKVSFQGNYAYRNKTHYISYEQLDEDSKEIVKNTLKLRDEEIRMIKRGDASSTMRFLKGYEHSSSYQTAVGSMQMKTYTHELDLIENEDEIIANLLYDLYLNNQYISKCKIRINVVNN